MGGFATSVAGWLFIAGVAMLWLGWMLLPAKLGAFFKPQDFEDVYARRRLWIWLFRVHLFGYIVLVMAFVALGVLSGGSPAGVLTWPGAAVMGVGWIVAALAAAFYYHFAAWGSADMHGKPAAEVQAFIDELRVPTEYVTCLVRFSRVFFGLGQLVLAAGLIYAGILPAWLVAAGGLLGAAAMSLTMALPDNLEYYNPLFHLNALWLAAMGIATLGADISFPS